MPLLLRVIAIACLVAPLRAETISFLGDSLTAGYGITAEEAYPALIQERLRTEAPTWRVVNAGVSGDTTKGGLARLGWVLRARPDVVVLALGANDGLRGLSLERTRANLDEIIRRLRERDVAVVLCGMHLPTNYGEDYRAGFRRIYVDLAREHALPFYSFLLDGVAMREDLNLADGVHPNAAGHRVIAERVFAFLRPVLGLDVAPQQEAGATAGDAVAADAVQAAPADEEAADVESRREGVETLLEQP